MSEIMTHNISHVLTGLPGALGYNVDNGCVVVTFLAIDPDSDNDALARRQAHASGQRSEMEPGATTPDGIYEQVLAGLPPYWLPLEEIDSDLADYETVVNARLDGLRLLDNMGFDIDDELKPVDEQESNDAASPQYKIVDYDSKLLDSLRYMIVLIDPDEYAKAHDNDGHLYRIYDRFTQERSAITLVSPAIIVVAEKLETGAGFYGLNRLNDMDLFAGTIGDVHAHSNTHEYEKLHNQPVPDNQAQAYARYNVNGTSPLAHYVAEYVAAEHDRVVDATESQFFLGKDNATDEEAAISTRAVNAVYRRCVHHLTSLVKSARSLIVLNGYGAHYEDSDLRVVTEKAAYLLSYPEGDHIYSLFSEVLKIPLMLGHIVDDHTPEAVRALIGDTEVARILRIALEKLVSLDLHNSTLSDEMAYRIRANTLDALICDAAVRYDYNEYHILTQQSDAHMDNKPDNAALENHISSDGTMSLIATSRELTSHIATHLSVYNASQRSESSDDLNVSDDIIAEVEAGA